MKGVFPLVPVLLLAALPAAEPTRIYTDRIAAATGTPGCVAFRDFVQR
jgi:hypothetical protein